MATLDAVGGMPETTIQTDADTAVHDVTDAVDSLVPAGHDGACIVDVPHTTAAITVNEAEPNLVADLRDMLTAIVPEEGHAHDRIDDNASAHLRASLLGASTICPVERGTVSLGTWQAVLLVECDGPRQRTLRVHPLAGSPA